MKKIVLTVLTMAMIAGPVYAADSVTYRPMLNSATISDDGGLCIDQHDTAELMQYIDTLESK